MACALSWASRRFTWANDHSRERSSDDASMVVSHGPGSLGDGYRQQDLYRCLQLPIASRGLIL